MLLAAWTLVLNLIITGIPSIPFEYRPKYIVLAVLNLIITGIPSILHIPSRCH